MDSHWTHTHAFMCAVNYDYIHLMLTCENTTCTQCTFCIHNIQTCRDFAGLNMALTSGFPSPFCCLERRVERSVVILLRITAACALGMAAVCTSSSFESSMLSPPAAQETENEQQRNRVEFHSHFLCLFYCLLVVLQQRHHRKQCLPISH